VAYWPTGLTDGCATLELVHGDAIDAPRFAPESWALLTPSAAPPPPTAVATALPALDGRGGGVLAYYSERDGNAEIYLMNADGSAERRLTFNEADDYSPAWSPDAERIAFESDRNDPNPVRCFPNCTYDLYVMNADGTGERQLTDTPYFSETNPDWSPDGTRIMYDADADGDGNGEIYVLNVEDALPGSAEPQRLTDGKSDDRFADWSPDGTQIVFNSQRDGNWEIYVMNADGTDPRRLTDNTVNDFFPDWSPDGTQIAFFVMPANLAARGQDLYVMNVDGSDVRRLTETQTIVDEDPVWSPDGKRLAFQSDRDGNFEIYVINVDGTNEQRLTRNRSQEYWPAWRP
jgi:TolB protein